jgi:dsRNA-specific ribonuclease
MDDAANSVMDESILTVPNLLGTAEFRLIRLANARLQELAARDGVRPEYLVEGAGPDHDRRFTAVVSVKGTEYGWGEGRSKKQAEQDAARQALDTLNRDSRSTDSPDAI